MHEQLARRQFLTGFGATAFAALAGENPAAAPHFKPTAKSVIYLHMSGGPSQLDLFDPKPQLKKHQGQDLPGSIRMGQRITGMTSGQSTLPVASSLFSFAKQGQSGMEMSEIIPWHHKIADEICLVRSVHTEAINHDPAITFIQTGFQQPGRPSIGSWVSYGLGSENKNLPGFVVMISQKSAINTDQPLFSRLWSAGFLPSSYQGVKFRAGSDPVLYLNDPDGMDTEVRRGILDLNTKLNQMRAGVVGDPEIETRIAQYEMAFKMQTSVPELMDLSKENEATFAMYGPEAKKPGSFAQQCLLARRLVERGVRFVQLYNRGWDQHNDLPRDIQLQARATDQASAALVIDLKQRGLLKDTLVVWGGEFGRTVYCQGRLTETNYGRDHHPRCFSMWMAGGGIKPGTVIGETDDYSYNIVKDAVHVHDIQATLLHCLGVDHTKLTYKFQGRHFRLTDVHGSVVKAALA
ncbi:MAG: DUF1501 domain-containing protein [Bryobacter sp.]|jgi:hypothetical protein|nr:DUF1501 domain-containing protein [Bryobacter sp. CoA8 C33]